MALAAVLGLIGTILAVSALTASVAVATPRAPAWKLPPSVSLSDCASPCSLQRRLLDARVRRDESASMPGAGTANRAAQQARPALKEQSGFEGTVTDAKTTSPVMGIEVCAFELKALEEGAYEEEELEPACGVVAESTGRYRIGLPPAQYVVGFFDPVGNYLTQFYKGRSPGEPVNLVTVEAEKFTKKIDAALSEGGRVEGTVTAASGGASLEGFRVCALDLAIEEFKCGVTGGGGKYQIGGLRAGTYELGFFVREAPGHNYFDATLPGVKVTLGTTTSGANAALASGGEIEGVVTTAEGGAPLAHAVVCAFLASGEEVEECVETGADGSYIVERLPTGSYEVEFEDFPEYLSQFFDGVPHLAQATAISVTAGAAPVTNVDDALFKHGGTIKGHVASEVGDAPLGGAEVCAIAAPAHVVACTHSNAEGEYSFTEGELSEGIFTGELPEGSYKIEFRDPPDYSTAFYAGKATLGEGALVPVALGATVEGINALLHLTGVHVEGSGSIAGRVTAQATGLPLAGAIVCADAATSRCEETGSDGTYVIDDLPEGEYAVEFKDAPGFLTRFYDEAPSRAEATLVQIGAETNASAIDAQLRPVLPPSRTGAAQTTSSAGIPAHPATSGVLSTKIVAPSATVVSAVRVSGRRASVKLHCAVGPCHGTVALTITVIRRHRAHGHTVVRRVQLGVGSGTFSLAQGATGPVTIHLTSHGKALLARVARRPRLGKLKLALQGAAARATAVTIR